MALGPIEILAIEFPGNRFRGEISAALQELVENETIRIIDLVFVKKDAEGNITALELGDLDPDDFLAFDPITSEVSDMLNEEDIQSIAAGIQNDSSVGVMLFEDTWATRFKEAAERANGHVLIAERIPSAVIDELVASQSAPR
jgi:hypothetical protein